MSHELVGPLPSSVPIISPFLYLDASGFRWSLLGHEGSCLRDRTDSLMPDS